MNAPPLVSSVGFCSVCNILREDDCNGLPISDCICSAKLRHKADCGYVTAVSCPVSARSCERHSFDACEECDCTCGAGSRASEQSAIEVPDHLAGCGRCSSLYKLLVRAYSPDRGAEYDAECDQEHLCDLCGVTACATQGCKCSNVLCPHGRQNLRRRAGG